MGFCRIFYFLRYLKKWKLFRQLARKLGCEQSFIKHYSSSWEWVFGCKVWLNLKGYLFDLMESSSRNQMSYLFHQVTHQLYIDQLIWNIAQERAFTIHRVFEHIKKNGNKFDSSRSKLYKTLLIYGHLNAGFS